MNKVQHNNDHSDLQLTNTLMWPQLHMHTEKQRNTHIMLKHMKGS